MPIDPSAVIHETARVDEPCDIGPGTRVWHYTHIRTGAVLGAHCNVGQGAYIGAGVRIGEGCKIQNGVNVYEGVTLEDHVFCGPCMVFTNVINPRAEIERKAEFRPTLVRRGATIGANATVICGVTIGEYAFIGAGSVVTEDIHPYALIVGVPGKQMGWMSRAGHRLQFDSPSRRAVCPQTGEEYQLLENGLCVPV